MKFSSYYRTGLILLTVLTLAACGTPNSEKQAPAPGGLSSASVSPPTQVPLAEKLDSAIRSVQPGTNATVKVTSMDGIVLLTGQVLTGEAKSQATNAAVFSGGSGLRQLSNELRVVDTIDTSRLEQDALLTASVESLLSAGLPDSAQNLKTVVENGRVYLLGVISHEQGAAALDLVGRLKGVDSITTVFQYTD